MFPRQSQSLELCQDFHARISESLQTIKQSSLLELYYNDMVIHYGQESKVLCFFV